MDEIHDFDDTVVAILDDDSDAETAVRHLDDAGYDYELLRGEEGKEHIDPSGDSGPGATLKRLITALGDQRRVADRLSEELDAGRLVVSVDAKPDEAGEAVRILDESGGDFIWKLGTWTFTRID